MPAHHEAKYYKRLFTETPYWSTPFPNPDEAARWGKICLFLSRITHVTGQDVSQGLRILDVGCGRGWLTNLAGIYGYCEGIDPVEEVVMAARRLFPGKAFFVGAMSDMLKRLEFEPYDVVIASEVIEHVQEKDCFIGQLRRCIRRGGHIILSTPRGECFRQWKHLGYGPQPIEEWIAEKELERLCVRQGLIRRGHERVYLDLPKMSFLHRYCASPKVDVLHKTMRLTWLLHGLRYLASFYQVWWFEAA